MLKVLHFCRQGEAVVVGQGDSARLVLHNKILAMLGINRQPRGGASRLRRTLSLMVEYKVGLAVSLNAVCYAAIACASLWVGRSSADNRLRCDTL